MSRLRKLDAERRALRPKNADYVEALARGIAVLNAFSDRHRMSLSEVARLVDIPKPSVRRSLITLSELGYLSSNGRHFEITAKVVALAAAYLSSNPIVEFLQPSCERISKQTGLSCAIAILDGTHALTVTTAYPSWPPTAEFTSGRRLSLLETALGLMLLATLPDAERDSLLGAMAQATPVGVAHAAHSAIARAVRCVFAITGGNLPGFPALAVPLRRRDGRAFGAYGIALPSQEAMREGARRELVCALISEAAVLQRHLI
jgi:IclR family pca regulon transcriptional regulator